MGACQFWGALFGAIAIHLGCGFDSRFERVDDAKVDWYNLDLPDVIALGGKFLDGEKPHYHLLSSSVFTPTWMGT